MDLSLVIWNTIPGSRGKRAEKETENTVCDIELVAPVSNSYRSCLRTSDKPSKMHLQLKVKRLGWLLTTPVLPPFPSCSQVQGEQILAALEKGYGRLLTGREDRPPKICR